MNIYLATDSNSKSNIILNILIPETIVIPYSYYLSNYSWIIDFKLRFQLTLVDVVDFIAFS